jgi:hypothetical protein
LRSGKLADMNTLKAELNRIGKNPYRASIACGWAPSTVTRHLAAKRVPADACVVYERCLGIPREVLRPDLWPPEIWQARRPEPKEAA